jgi:hypothetical protein
MHANWFALVNKKAWFNHEDDNVGTCRRRDSANLTFTFEVA